MNKEIALGYALGYLTAAASRGKSLSVGEMEEVIKYIEWLTFVEIGVQDVSSR